MPVSKKRKKKRRARPSGPPPSKEVLAAKQSKLSKRQIAIYVFSALIILSLAISFIIGSVGPATPQTGVPQTTNGENNTLILTPAAENQQAEESDVPTESEAEADGNAASEPDSAGSESEPEGSN